MTTCAGETDSGENTTLTALPHETMVGRFPEGGPSATDTGLGGCGKTIEEADAVTVALVVWGGPLVEGGRGAGAVGEVLVTGQDTCNERPSERWRVTWMSA